MSRGSKIIHITDKKITGLKTKVLEHVIDSGLERALEVFEQRQEDTWHKTTPETMSPFAVMNMVWSDEGMKKTPETRSPTEGDRFESQTFLCRNQEIVFGFAREDALFVFSAHGKTKSVL